MTDVKDFSFSALASVLDEHIAGWRSTRFLCALSGGIDSMVLLHALRALTDDIRCLHVNHGIQAHSSSWAEFCVEQCEQLECQIEIYELSVDSQTNLEERLRDARLEIFQQQLLPGEVLITAHHQDDQIETFFLQLMRGAGPAGLRAMTPKTRAFGAGRLFRPLLSFSREQLHAFAIEQSIAWVEDPSNANEKHDRNYWRRQIAPKLKERWPGIRKTVSRSIELLAESDLLIRQLAELDAHIDEKARSLDWQAICDFDEARIANALRYWLDTLKVRPPSRARLREAVRQFIHAGQDRVPSVCWPGGCIERYRDNIVYRSNTEPPDVAAKFSITGTDWCELPTGYGRLRLVAEQGCGILQRLVNRDNVVVQFRQDGLRLRRKSGHHQSIKKWFQEQGIEPSARSRIPLIFYEGALIAIADLWIDHRFRAQASQEGWQIEWQK